MIDPSDPLRASIFKSAGQLDHIKLIVHRLTTTCAPSERESWLQEVAKHFQILQAINLSSFGSSPYITSNLDAYARQLKAMGAQPFPANWEPGRCRLCGSPLESSSRSAQPDWESDDVFCRSCLTTLLPLMCNLQAGEGFQTEYI